mmetsp:Transcript_17977/g.36221  ORF Transcript_17977/g.36221 Transcript_17977/m.36221 type:complete len:84 (-) Transcript_17977:56-307(-)
MKKKVAGVPKRTALGVMVGEQVILTPALLAYFDSLVATSPWVGNVTKAEQKTQVMSLNADWMEEHGTAAATTALKELFAKRGW